MEKKALSITDSARAISIGRSKFYQIIAQGKGPPIVHIGSRSLILTEDLDAWLRRMRTPAE